ncbi:hypothetical protein THAOC_36381 [Thalassiosira oceanica]|uniref:Uncharacterized protein n=1 Tax=Thalassiosira oceanica TaxID=159749 RepID=K0REN6_THAOC|nr:hypothetical protein THAOC_36381 [Thalassiosira oceanica]|eukprot:EJK45032.1 hypothetical protein THAOC_36381 [Thalassiosira oceanica]
MTVTQRRIRVVRVRAASGGLAAFGLRFSSPITLRLSPSVSLDYNGDHLRPPSTPPIRFVGAVVADLDVDVPSAALGTRPSRPIIPPLPRPAPRLDSLGTIDEYWEIDRQSRFLHPFEHIWSSPASRQHVDHCLNIAEFQASDVTMGASLSLPNSFDDENGRRRVRYLDSLRQTALETSSTGYRRLIYVSNGCVLLPVYLRGVERHLTSRPKWSVIAGSTALTDARIEIGGRFWSGIHSSATSMVHLRPILAIARWSSLPCFDALGFVLCGWYASRTKAYGYH